MRRRLTSARTTIVASACVVCLALPITAQPPPNAAVDRIFAQYDTPASPGCAIGAVQNNRYVYQRGYGMANLDYDLPNSPAMVYYVGSVSKQFTATIIALLSLQGKVSLDDDIRKYFPELPVYQAPITIRHLVHHTSGIRDIYNLMGLRGDRLEDLFSDSAALALIARQRGLGFKPGDSYSYSNSGYFLLGQLVKRVTGLTLREYADRELFAPLGMMETHFHDDPGHVMKRRAMSYERDGRGGFRISYIQNFDKVGAGGLYSTIDDLRKWDENFYAHRVGGEALQKLIHTRGLLNKGDTLPYAYGNTIGVYRGLRVVEHGGALMGYKAYILRFPDQHFSVLLTCNLGAIDPGPLAHAVAEVFIGDRMGPPPQRVATPAAGVRPPADARPRTTNAAADLIALAGDYYSEDLGVMYRVRKTPDSGLSLRGPSGAPTTLTPTGRDAFRAGSTIVRFERRSGSDAATALTLTVSRIGDLRLVRQ